MKPKQALFLFLFLLLSDQCHTNTHLNQILNNIKTIQDFNISSNSQIYNKIQFQDFQSLKSQDSWTPAQETVCSTWIDTFFQTLVKKVQNTVPTQFDETQLNTIKYSSHFILKSGIFQGCKSVSKTNYWAQASVKIGQPRTKPEPPKSLNKNFINFQADPLDPFAGGISNMPFPVQVCMPNICPAAMVVKRFDYWYWNFSKFTQTVFSNVIIDSLVDVELVRRSEKKEFYYDWGNAYALTFWISGGLLT